MFKINSILEILNDGKSHRIEKLKIENRVDDFEMLRILTFLIELDIIEKVDDKKVKINRLFRQLFFH